ncbi:MAG: LapA family protein [Planctomycetota bacterium]
MSLLPARRWKRFFGAILFVLALIVAFQNTETVETRFFFATLKMPRAVLLFATLLLGFLIGVLVTAGWRRRQSAK